MGGGPAIGGTLGCNWQPTSLLLFGVEGEGGYMRVHASSVDPYSYAHAADTVSYTRIGRWEADLAGRAGLVLWDRVLLYVKGGVGFTKIASSPVRQPVATKAAPNRRAKTQLGFALRIDLVFGPQPDLDQPNPSSTSGRAQADFPRLGKWRVGRESARTPDEKYTGSTQRDPRPKPARKSRKFDTGFNRCSRALGSVRLCL